MKNSSDDTSEVGLLDEPASSRDALAAQLRALRRSRAMTLEQVARESGISTSFLSAVERGQVDISLARFRRLANVYEVRASDLLADTEAHTNPQLTLPGGGSPLDRGDGVEFRVLPNLEYGAQALHMVLEPGAAFNKEVTHKGADIIWVYEGDLTLVHAAKSYLIPSGSCVSFAATVPHSYRNDGDRTARAFGVATSSW